MGGSWEAGLSVSMRNEKGFNLGTEAGKGFNLRIETESCKINFPLR